MKRRIIKKSEILREGYVKGLKKAQRIINEMLGDMVNDEDCPETLDVIADNDDDAIWTAECNEQCDIKSWDDITYGEEDGTVWATISGIVWGEKWKR